MENSGYKKHDKYKKYKKYKKKIEKITKILHNGFITKNISEQYIQNNFNKINNKGTQNCGVFLKLNDNNKILVCSKNRMNSDDKQFLLTNEGIYPKLYEELIELSLDKLTNKKINKYYYLWEKMDGDIRTLYHETIPMSVLGNNYNIFEYKLDKPYTIYYATNDLFDLMNRHNGYRIIETRFLYQDEDSGKLFCNRKDYENIIYRINSLKSCSDIYIDVKFKNILNQITSVHTQLIKSISKHIYTLIQNDYFYTDLKLDNIVYKYDNDSNKYNFFLIDPDSTLSKNSNFIGRTREKSLIQLMTYIKNKFENFKMNDLFPDMYNTFLEPMFNIIELDDGLYVGNDVDKLYALFNIPLGIGECAMNSYKINPNKVLPINFSSENELINFFD